MKKDVDSFTWLRETNTQGVRMLTNNVSQFRMVVNAKLLKSISYMKVGVEHVVAPGTALKVDLDRMVALIAGHDDYTDVTLDEIIIDNVN